MKKVVLASLLAAAGAASLSSIALAQDAAPAAGSSQGQITLPPDEYNVYSAAMAQTAPAAKVQALKAYLTKYPNSPVKSSVLTDILGAATQTGDKTQILDASSALLAVDPNNLRALAFEVYYGRTDADKLTDPAAKQAALDKVAAYAQTGLTVDQGSTPPKGMSDADFNALKPKTMPVFSSAIADADMAKKDNAGAITVLKQELAAVPAEQTQQVGPILQDEYTLANAYYTSTPPDYLNCAWYATRTAAFAPAAQQASIKQLASYCYNKYHGSPEGYDKFTTMAQGSLNPPSDLATTITPAPKPEDIVKNLIATTPDLATLALSDKEFVLQYGSKADADKVFDSVKGKSVEIPGAIVVAATADQVQVAVSDDAKNAQPKVADFTFAMKTPLTNIPAVGSTVNISGTYSSYTSANSQGADSTASTTTGAASSTTPATTSTTDSTAATSTTPASGTASTTTAATTPAAGTTTSPFMIQMTDGAIVEPKKETPKTTRTPARRPATRRH